MAATKKFLVEFSGRELNRKVLIDSQDKATAGKWAQLQMRVLDVGIDDVKVTVTDPEEEAKKKQEQADKAKKAEKLAAKKKVQKKTRRV